jgi:hypothetical protein
MGTLARHGDLAEDEHRRWVLRTVLAVVGWLDYLGADAVAELVGRLELEPPDDTPAFLIERSGWRRCRHPDRSGQLFAISILCGFEPVSLGACSSSTPLLNVAFTCSVSTSVGR